MSILFHAPYPVSLKSIQEEDGEDFSERPILEEKNVSNHLDVKGSILLDLCSEILREIQKDVSESPHENSSPVTDFHNQKPTVRNRSNCFFAFFL